MVLPNVDIFPMDYYQNGSIIQVNGSVFCVNTSSTSLVTSPVFSKSSHVSTHVPNFLLMNRFCSLFLFLLDRYSPNDVQLLLSHHLRNKIQYYHIFVQSLWYVILKHYYCNYRICFCR